MMIKFIYLIIFIFLNIDITQACSCIIYDGYEKDIYRNSELIFIGKSINQTILSIENATDPFLSNDTKIDFDVTEVIKGEKKDLISVRTNNRTSCGVSTQTWEEYLIFSSKNSKEEYTVWTCNILSLSNAEDILQNFREIKEQDEKYYNIKKSIISLIMYIKQVCLSYMYWI